MPSRFLRLFSAHSPRPFRRRRQTGCRRDHQMQEVVLQMFGKIVVGKALVGLAAAGVVSGALATGVLAAPAAASASASPSPAAHQRAARKDLFAGTVTAISDTQVTIKDRAGASRTFLRDAATRVYRGKDLVSWSEIEV